MLTFIRNWVIKLQPQIRIRAQIVKSWVGRDVAYISSTQPVMKVLHRPPLLVRCPLCVKIQMFFLLFLQFSSQFFCCCCCCYCRWWWCFFFTSIKRLLQLILPCAGKTLIAFRLRTKPLGRLLWLSLLIFNIRSSAANFLSHQTSCVRLRNVSPASWSI